MKPKKKLKVNIPTLYLLGLGYQLVKQGLVLFFVYGLVSLTGLFTVINHPWIVAFILLFGARFVIDWLDSTERVINKLVAEQYSKDIKKSMEDRDK